MNRNQDNNYEEQNNNKENKINGSNTTDALCFKAGTGGQGHANDLDNKPATYPERIEKPGTCIWSRKILRTLDMWTSGEASISQTLKMILRTLEKVVRHQHLDHMLHIEMQKTFRTNNILHKLENNERLEGVTGESYQTISD